MNLLSNKSKTLLSFPDKVIITTALTKSDGFYTEKKKSTNWVFNFIKLSSSRAANVISCAPVFIDALF